MSTKGTPSPHQLRCRKINAGCASFVGCLEWRPPSGLLYFEGPCDQDKSSQDYAVFAVADFKGKSTTCSATWTRMSSSGGKKCGPKRGPF